MDQSNLSRMAPELTPALGMRRVDHVHPGWRAVRLAVAGGLLAVAVPARALDWGILGGLAAAHENNLFRLPGDVPGASDTTVSIGSGLVLDMPGRTFDAHAEADVRRTWFARNPGLDNTGYGVSAEASATGPLQLDASARRDRRLSNFGDIRADVRNIQTLTTLDSQARLAVAGDFRAVIGGSLVRSTNSSAEVSFSDYQSTGFSAGAGYYSPAGNHIALLFTRLDGRGLADRLIDLGPGLAPLLYRQSYVQGELGMRVHVAPSALTSADIHIGHVDRNDRSALHKDLNGVIGDVAVTWKPRRTIDVTIRAGRQLQSDSYVYSDSVREDFASLALRDRVTRTLTAGLTYSWDRQRFVYDIQAPVPLEPRADRRQTVRVTLARALTPHLDLELEGRHEWRLSTDSAFRYADTGASLTLSAHFGAAARAAP